MLTRCSSRKDGKSRFSYGNVRILAQSGFCKSSGSMAHLADVISLLSEPTNCWSAEHARWCCFYYLYTRQKAKFESFLRKESRVLTARSDSTEFRLRPEASKVCTDEISVCCFEAYGIVMSVAKNFPVFSRVPDKSYKGILAYVGLEALPKDHFLQNETDVRFETCLSEWNPQP